MPEPIKPATKAAVKNSYLKEGLSLAAAAAKHGVSPRIVNKWSSTEGWAAAKENRPSDGGQPIKLVTFAPERGGQQAQQQVEPALDVPESTEDLIEILDQAIARLSAAIHQPHDRRNQANAANALAKLIAQRCALADTHERKSRRAAIEFSLAAPVLSNDEPLL